MESWNYCILGMLIYLGGGCRLSLYLRNEDRKWRAASERIKWGKDVCTSTLKGRGPFVIVWVVVVFLTVIFDLSEPLTHSVWASILCIWKCGGGCVWIRRLLKFFAFQSHIHINHNRKCGWGSGGIKTFLNCWHDSKLVQFGENVAVWIKLNMYITCYPVISLWGIFLQKTFIHVHRETKTNILTAQYL